MTCLHPLSLRAKERGKESLFEIENAAMAFTPEAADFNYLVHVSAVEIGTHAIASCPSVRRFRNAQVAKSRFVARALTNNRNQYSW
jgi:hypothetical protein